MLGLRRLISLPPVMAPHFSELFGRPAPQWFAGFDPVGGHVGSGGGTAWLLANAFQASGRSDFHSWLGEGPLSVIHAGGQSRRFPTFGAVGKLFVPIPPLPGWRGQKTDSTLLDLIDPLLEKVLARGRSNARLIIGCGDFYCQIEELPTWLPEADIVVLGLATSRETAKKHGVFFGSSQELVKMLQKPSDAELDACEGLDMWVDTGIWILSDRAVDVLMKKSGWTGSEFEGGSPKFVDLYGGFGLSLGSQPTVHDPDLAELTSALVPIEGRFLHFGSERESVSSTSVLAGRELPEKPSKWISRIPLTDGSTCIRLIGLDDAMRGPCRTAELGGQHLVDWLDERGLSLESAGIDSELDIFEAPLFPCIRSGFEEMEAFLISGQEDPNVWLSATRVSAADLLVLTDVCAAVAGMREQERARRALTDEQFFLQDLEGISPGDRVGSTWTEKMHLAMMKGDDGIAFQTLRAAVIDPENCERLFPESGVKQVTALAPLRLDLAGGWTDTPPYCLLEGGIVTNAAVTLNGREPVEVRVRPTDEHAIRIVNLNTQNELIIHSFEGLRHNTEVGSEFVLAQIALQLSGFNPEFSSKGFTSLDEALEELGCGLEISTGCSVQQGSGLGASSILAAAILSALSAAFSFNWDQQEILRRTTVLEQILGAGGGWQDQAGGSVPGVKRLTTVPGAAQWIDIEPLAANSFVQAAENGLLLVYSTGKPRIARQLLAGIVRGMFLNNSQSMKILAEIKDTGYRMGETLKSGTWEEFGRCLATASGLKRELDPGSVTPEIARLFEAADDLAYGVKMMGAGGGGFLIVAAKDLDAAKIIRNRFGEIHISETAQFFEPSVAMEGIRKV